MHYEGGQMMVLEAEEYERLWVLVEELEGLLWKVKNLNEEGMHDHD